MAYPVGRTLTDFQGWVAPSEVTIDWPAALRAAGLRGWEYDAGLCHADTPPHGEYRSSPWADLSQGFEAYCQQRRQAGSCTIRKAQQKWRAMERAHDVRFDCRANSSELLQTLAAWKEDTYRTQGIRISLTRYAVPTLWRHWIEQRTPHFEGLLSAVWCDERPAALAYTLRHRHAAWCWFISYDAAWSRFSPGIGLLLRVMETLANEGVTQFHFGCGDERFKTSLATDSWTVGRGVVGANSREQLWLRSCLAARMLLVRSPLRGWLRACRAASSQLFRSRPQAL
jgi:CelD/BcsL family acetyltransferase involved in cellulose biosynthesis